MAFGRIGFGFARLAPWAAGVCLTAAALSAAVSPAEARRHYRAYHARWRAPAISSTPATSIPSEVEASKYSAIVVDANTGREIWGVNENALRHPASITKVMTLYLLFEQLEKGNLSLDSRIPVSEHAAAQEPSKLGVPAGDSIAVEDAIKSIVTRSANDMAVAVAEAVGHDESSFAALMTRKAHQLGMSRTLYRNASGLPNDEQWTTARDLTVLARSLQERFPTYYKYFSIHEFTYDGEVIGNHDHMLGRLDGVDGIKTGYTRASGFNLLTSVHRDGRALVAVVMGGRSAPARDNLMARMIESHFAELSPERSATRIAESTPDSFSPVAPEPQARVAERDDDAPVASVRREAPQTEAEGDSDDDAPRPLKAVPAAPQPRPVAKAELSPRERGWVKGAAPVKPAARAAASAERVARRDDDESWMIQVGATDTPAKARFLMARAKSRTRSLASLRGFTQKVRRDGDTLYRVRFAGLDTAQAARVCRDLKHGGLACVASRD